MKGILDLDSPVMVFLSKLAELMLVNLLWIICSLPVITIGASTTALYYVCFKIVNDEETRVFVSFFKAFADNFKQATIIWLILFSTLAFIVFDIYSIINLSRAGSVFDTISLFIFGFILAVWISIFIYAFALQSHFENSVARTIRNSAILGLSYYGYTIIMVVCNTILTVLGVIFLPILIPAVPIWLNTLIMRKIFAQLTPQ